MRKVDEQMTAAIAGFRSWKGGNTEVLPTYFHQSGKLKVYSRVFFNDDLIARCYLFEKCIVLYRYPCTDPTYLKRMNAILLEFTTGAYCVDVENSVPVLKQKAPSEWECMVDDSYFYI